MNKISPPAANAHFSLKKMGPPRIGQYFSADDALPSSITVLDVYDKMDTAVPVGLSDNV